VKAYIAHRLELGASRGTVSNELAWLRRTFRLAIETGDILTMPKFRMLQTNNARRGFFKHSEFLDVRAALPTWLQGVVTFAYITGWRVQSEILPLTIDRVDMDRGIVRLDVGTTKNGEGRQFIMTEELRFALEAQLASIKNLRSVGVFTHNVFHRPDGSAIKEFRTYWKRACEAAGVPGRLLHDFRRTAVRTMERAGVPRSVAMSMVGHKTEAIYRRYAIVDLQMQQEASLKMEAFARASADGPREATTGRATPFK
jgi:integrase